MDNLTRLERYKYLEPTFRRLLFEKVHEPLFMEYLATLRNVINSYQTNFYPISDKTNKKQKDLESVCFALNSISFLQTLFWDSSNDSYFLLASNSNLFDALISSYQNVVKNTIMLISEDLFGSIEGLLATYERYDIFILAFLISNF